MFLLAPLLLTANISEDVHIPIQDLGFSCVSYSTSFPSVSRCVSINTASRRIRKTGRTSWPNSQILNWNVYKAENADIYAEEEDFENIDQEEIEQISPELIANIEYRDLQKNSPFLPSFEDIPENTRKTPQMRSWNVLLYGQGSYVRPGIGLGIRYFAETTIVEANASLAPYTGKFSLSLLSYFANFYVGGGIGRLAVVKVEKPKKENDSTESIEKDYPERELPPEPFFPILTREAQAISSYYIPIVIGLQQKQFFLDIGIDLLIPRTEDFVYFPSIRGGFCF